MHVVIDGTFELNYASAMRVLIYEDNQNMFMKVLSDYRVEKPVKTLKNIPAYNQVA